MSKLYRLKSDHAVKCEAVFLPTSRAKGGLDSMRFIFLDEEWILPVTEFDRHWEPDLPPAPPVLAEDELGRLAGQLDGWLTIGPLDGRASAALLRRAVAELRRLRAENKDLEERKAVWKTAHDHLKAEVESLLKRPGLLPTDVIFQNMQVYLGSTGDDEYNAKLVKQFAIYMKKLQEKRDGGLGPSDPESLKVPPALEKHESLSEVFTKLSGTKPRKVLITMPWHWFPGSPIVPIPATIEELPE